MEMSSSRSRPPANDCSSCTNVLTSTDGAAWSVQPFAERWADAYRAGHPGLPIHIQGGGSTAGVEAAISGAAQIGMSSRRLTAG